MPLQEHASQIEQAVAKLNKYLGPETVQWPIVGVPAGSAISSGSIALDTALGIGGFPRGRIVEIFGPEGGGKTTIVLHAIANVQKANGIAAFLDTDHALDLEHARRIGVQTRDLVLSQPTVAEQALKVVMELLKTRVVDLIVVDSLAALVPKLELELNFDSDPAALAELISRSLRQLVGEVVRANACLIFTNQIRLQTATLFGNPETSCGGLALKHYASIRLDVRRIAAVHNGDEVIGIRTAAKVIKSRVAPPYRVAEFDLLFEEGISRECQLLELGVVVQLVDKNPVQFSFRNEPLGHDREAARVFLKSNPEIAETIESAIREKLTVDHLRKLDSYRPPTLRAKAPCAEGAKIPEPKAIGPG